MRLKKQNDCRRFFRAGRYKEEPVMKTLLCILLIISLMLPGLCLAAETAPLTPEEQQAYMDSLKLRKIEDYLYLVTVPDYDYQSGIDKARELFMPAGGCAAIQNGGLRGRNYDWTYDDQAYFVIYTPADGAQGRHAVLGISGSIKELTKDVVESGEWNSAYRSLPFATLDGINDAGLICNILVVPSGAHGYTTGSNPGMPELSASMVNRYVLDFASTVDEAIELLRGRNIYMPHTAYMDQEFHWMISDRERTVMIEFIDNEMVVLEDERISTNFYLFDFDKTRETVQEVPEGIERYDIIAAGYDTTGTREGMMDMLMSIFYSKTYSLDTVPFWYSEYASVKGLHSGDFGAPDLSGGDLSLAGSCRADVEKALASWAKGRGAENNTWISVYSAVYDMDGLELELVFQENRGRKYIFSMESIAAMMQ
ncbi:MAG: hypothetical protein CW338_06375 [Clostridiales bacterium]|nr:hypothetical protein [Clostridiales bacterium]